MSRQVDTLRLRTLSIGVLLVVAWVGVTVRLAGIQGADAAALAQRGDEQRLRTEPQEAKRGTIYDREGHELAVTVDGVSVRAVVADIDDPVGAATSLSPLLELPVAEIMSRLAKGDSPYLARRLDQRIGEQVAALGIRGITLEDELRRVYPAGDLAAQVLGVIEFGSGEGLAGLERQYDTLLTGDPGVLVVERDPRGAPIPQGTYELNPARPGGDLITTLDREIQYVVETALRETVEEWDGRVGTVVVLAPDTGEILAMASFPTFDPNNRATALPELMKNRAVTDVYEPGSTQKVVTIAAALEEGVVRPGDVLEVPQSYTINDKEYRDLEHHDDYMSVEDIVTFSSNVGTIKIEELLGDEGLFRYLHAFGLGSAAGVDFPGEEGGFLWPLDQWCQTTCGASTAIGYRVSVTALQMAGVYATIANDGQWVQPHLVSAVVDDDGVRSPVAFRRRRVVSPLTAQRLRIMLERVVREGTGRRAAVPGYRVGGKTGTTEKYLPDEERYSEDDVVASFIGMAPATAPEIVVAVVIDSPQGEDRFGGVVAAPVFARIMEAALHQLGVPPDA